MNTSIFVVQDEKALYDAARRGDVSAVKRLIAGHVNVDCTPYQVYHHIMCTYVVCNIKYVKHIPVIIKGSYAPLPLTSFPRMTDRRALLVPSQRFCRCYKA